MTDQNDNMKLWNSWCKTDPSTTKEFKGKGGFKGNAICAQSQTKNATRTWGPMGHKWGVRNESYTFLDALCEDGKTKLQKLAYTAELYYPVDKDGAEASIPISSDLDLFSYARTYKTWSANNDIYKKASTDALTKGLSRLGMNSDVFEGKFDDSKYIQDMAREFAGGDQGRPAAADKKPQQSEENLSKEMFNNA